MCCDGGSFVRAVVKAPEHKVDKQLVERVLD